MIRSGGINDPHFELIRAGNDWSLEVWPNVGDVDDLHHVTGVGRVVIVLHRDKISRKSVSEVEDPQKTSFIDDVAKVTVGEGRR